MQTGSDHAPGPVLRDDMTVTADAGGCDPAILWELLSQPRWWPHRAPHISRARSADAADDRPVAAGDRVRIDGHDPLHVTAAITRVGAPARWDFRVDLPVGHALEAAHEVICGPPTHRPREGCA